MGVNAAFDQKKATILTYVERRLIEWAEWYSSGNFYGLGYLPCSIEYRLMTEGIVKSAASSGLRSLPSNEAAEAIEVLVVEMAGQNASMAKALRGYYFMGGSLRRKAMRLGISHTQLKYAVDMAHQWMAGRLSGRNNHRNSFR